MEAGGRFSHFVDIDYLSKMDVKIRLIFVLLAFACFGCPCDGEKTSNLVKNRYLESTKEVLQVLGQVYGRLAKVTGAVIKGHCNKNHREADTTSPEINSSYDEGKVLDTLVWIYGSLSELHERLEEIKMLAENDINYPKKSAMTMRGLGEVANRYLEPVEANFDKAAVMPRGGIDNSKPDLMISNKDQLKIAEILLKDIEVASSMLNKNNRLLLDKLKHFSEDNLYTVIVEDNPYAGKNSANQGLLTKAGARALKHAFSYNPDLSEEEETETHESDEELFKERTGNASPSISDESFSNSGDNYKPSNKMGTVKPFITSKPKTEDELLRSFDHLYVPKPVVKPVIPRIKSSDIGKRSNGWANNPGIIRAPYNPESNAISNPGNLFKDRSLVSKESDYNPMMKDKPSMALPIRQTDYHKTYKGIPLQDSVEKNSDLKKKMTGNKNSPKEEEKKSHENDEELFKTTKNRVSPTLPDKSVANSGDNHRRSNRVSADNPYLPSKPEKEDELPENFENMYDPKFDVKPVVPQANSADSRKRSSGRNVRGIPKYPVSKLFTEESNAFSNLGRSSGNGPISIESDYIPMIKDKPSPEPPLSKTGYYRKLYEGIPLQDGEQINSDAKKKM